MHIDLTFPNKIVFGTGKLEKIGELTKAFGKKSLIVTGKNSSKESGALDNIIKNLRKQDIEAEIFDSISGEPDTDLVDDLRQVLKEKDIDFVIGLGGGSVLDVAKAAAGLYGQEEATVEYINGKPFTYRGLAFIGVPTTAGTGSEVTLNSVLYNPRTKNKASLAHPKFQARLGLIDPILTYNMPADITASTGMDALTHAIESYTSKAANPVTMALAGEAISLIGQNILKTIEDGNNKEARSSMALGSLMAALAFSQTGVGVAHSISHPLGALFNIPHGIANAILLPVVVEYNYDACTEKYEEIANLLGGRGSAKEQIDNLLRKMPIPQRLEQAGYKKGKEADIIERTFQSRSISKNPRKVEKEDVIKILENAM